MFAREKNATPDVRPVWTDAPLADAERMASHRDDSDRNGQSAANTNAGTASAPSIHLHAESPMPPSSQLTTCETTMPRTTFSWKSAVILPRLSAGDISAI